MAEIREKINCVQLTSGIRRIRINEMGYKHFTVRINEMGFYCSSGSGYVLFRDNCSVTIIGDCKIDKHHGLHPNE